MIFRGNVWFYKQTKYVELKILSELSTVLQ